DAGRPRQLLHFSDVHLNLSASLDLRESAAIRMRYFRDAPLVLLESALTFAQQVAPSPDFFLYTGDHVAHGLFSDEYIAATLETNVKTIEKFFPPAGPSDADDSEQDGVAGVKETTAIIGNADGNPDYYMEVTNPNARANPSIEKVSTVWRTSLSAPNFEVLNRRGFLTYELAEKLHVLTLNTVPYSPSHVPDTSKTPDPFGQFAWLNATLAGLQAQGKFAYIAGHIAPIVDSYGGDPQWHPHYIAAYKSIVGRYAGVVKAQVFGHVHSVEFRVAPASVDAAAATAGAFELAPLFVSGSISPLFGNNPSFMVWDYDPATFDVLDYAVYGTNISEADQKLDWQLLFKASEAYGLKALANADLRDLYRRLEQSPALLETYYWNMKAQSHRGVPCSAALCRAKTLCSLKWWTTKGEYLACVDGAVTTATLVTTIATKDGDSRSGGARSQLSLEPSDVYVVIFMTVIATTVIVAVVLSVMRGLRRSGAIKTPEQREERERENFFPML
ncbi:hypothetical protein PybrP1_009451, partial [[Pythium] brassicae (nom. inval.)]